MQADDVERLTVAATLHDVGKMKIPMEILNKPGRLTDEEYREIQNHTLLGQQLIQNTEGTTDIDATVALQHHERLDGKGYPYGLTGKDIHYFSKIVAVADVFHATTSRRSYHNPLPFYKALQIIRDDAYNKLDPKISNVFIEKIMRSAVGKEIELSDGRIGTVVMVQPNSLLRPLIKIHQEFVDLSKQPQIFIHQVLG